MYHVRCSDGMWAFLPHREDDRKELSRMYFIIVSMIHNAINSVFCICGKYIEDTNL